MHTNSAMSAIDPRKIPAAMMVPFSSSGGGRRTGFVRKVAFMMAPPVSVRLYQPGVPLGTPVSSMFCGGERLMFCIGALRRMDELRKE